MTSLGESETDLRSILSGHSIEVFGRTALPVHRSLEC